MPSDSDGTDDHSLSNQESQGDAMHIGRRRSSGFWEVQTIYTHGKIRPRSLKVNMMENFTKEEQVTVYFEREQAIGDAEGLLAGYLGLLAIDCKSFPISFRKWAGPNGLPPSYFEECFINLIRPKFYFETSEEVAKRYCKMSLSKKWSQHRLKLCDEFYDPSMSREALIANVPTGIDAVQWASYVQYCLDPATLEMCRKNKEARKKQTIPHTGGSKPYARKRHEIFLATGRKASRGEIYIETHKKKDGSFVTDEARAIAEKIEMAMTENNLDESVPSVTDVVGKVLGEEHSGRVRCMGIGAMPTNTLRNVGHRSHQFTSCSTSVSSNKCCHDEHKRLLTALKAYFLSKEGCIPSEFAGILGRDAQVPDVDSEPDTPTTARRSSGGSNENHEDNA